MLQWESLSDLDVEVLVRDLFAAEWKTHVESFRRGPDGGIDLRVLGPTDPPLSLTQHQEILAQVKHYPDANLSRLRTAFKAEARRSIVKRSGIKYIAVTTAKMSVDAKSKIAALFNPPLDLANIYGREDLEALLVRHEKVKLEHLRLWLTDTTTLRAVLHGREHKFREYLMQQIERQAPLLVPTRHFEQARTILQHEGCVIVAGPPGVGKTSTALLLAALMIKEGRQLIVANDSLDDAERLMDRSLPQALFYDDFLGSSLHTAFFSGKNEDKRLARLVEEAGEGGDLRIILTTREYVLAAARQVHPRLSERRIDLTRLIIDASELDMHERAEILYRHIYFSDWKSVLDAGSPDRWIKILRHPLYNPRLISLYTKAYRPMPGAPSELRDEFVKGLTRAFEDPTELWRNVYDDHLSAWQRNLLLTVITIPYYANVDDLIEITSSWSQSVGLAQKTTSEWKRELRVLDGDFLSMYTRDSDTMAQVSNASIATYIFYRLSRDLPSILAILRSAVIFEQVQNVWSIVGASFDEQLREAWLDDEAREVVGSAPPRVYSTRERDLLRDAFRDAMLETLAVGYYSYHPSLGTRARRWELISSSNIARRLPIILHICSSLKIWDDQLTYAAMHEFVSSLRHLSGSSDDVLEAIQEIREDYPDLPLVAEMDAAAERFFFEQLSDGSSFSYAVRFLHLIGASDRVAGLAQQLRDAIRAYAFDRRLLDYAVRWDEELEYGAFAEAAELIGADVQVELAALKAALTDAYRRSTRKSARDEGLASPRVHEKQGPTRTDQGDTSLPAARLAARTYFGKKRAGP
ncbi:nSTAND3 domain-containing NTPase [Nonomuraea roseola]|uniref:AAA+ ATPase domain-containing protein n=1 Tax=Nonomuraea roseola TaxID=46179 RepID=A0ABV5QC58_9ACTN